MRFLFSAVYFFASLCTFVTSGHVASSTVRFRFVAVSKSDGGDPCAEKTTTECSGTSSTFSTVIAPSRSTSATTLGLWTI